jgi:hypothetical protein
MRNNFAYFNANPWGVEEEDCVCRAISAALSVKYTAVENLLDLISETNNCEKLCVCCYHKLLEGIFGLTPIYPEDMTVGEVAQDHPGSKLIIRINGHLTCSMYGVIIDIWDCTEKTAYCYWIVE